MALSNHRRPAPVALGLSLLPALLLAALPAPATAQAATEEVTVSGRLQVFYADDFDHRRASVLYYLEDPRSHRVYRLQLPRAPHAVGRSGSALTLHGSLSGETLTLDAGSFATLEATTTSTSTTSTTSSGSSTSTAPTTTRRALVMVANFQDASAECTTSAVDATMFTSPTNASVNALYQETSLGQLGFSGSVAGPYAVNDTVAGKCDLSGWAAALDAQAKAAGFDLTQYQNKVYVLPSSSACAVGVGSVGGSPGVTYVSRCGTADIYAHELGHNLGMNHASTPTDQYGDISDLMGYSGVGLRQLSAPHQQQLGWRAAGQMQTVSSSGYYSVAPLELDAASATAPQMLRIAKPDTGEYYYVSWRQPIGFDSKLSPSYYNLSVHRYAESGGRTYLMGSYADGQTFADSVNGITISAVSHSSSVYTVQLQFNASCTRSAPAVTLTPASQSGTAGSTLSYAFSVTNRDSGACAASSFSPTLSGLPSGWTASSSATTLSLAPGASGQATFSVTSATAAATGSYSFQAQASDAAVAAHTASASASYTVQAPCTIAAPTLAITPATQSSSAGQSVSYSLTLSNRDSSACSASSFALSRLLPAGWSGALSTTSLTLSPGQSGSATLTATSPTSTASGSYTLSASVSDATKAGHQASVSGVDSVAGAADTQAPTAPGALTASANRTQQRISLSWTAATDNVGVSSYRVWRDGAVIATVTTTSYVDTGISDTLTHAYSVTALDAAGNQSAASNTVSVSLASKRK